MAFDPERFDRAWQRYVTPLREQHPAFSSYLASGATEADLSAAEALVGSTLPVDLRYLLSKHNGSNEAQVLPGWELFSAQRIVDEWNVWADLREDQFVPDGLTCDPVGPIRADEWWRLTWLPFCGDGGGNHLCVDLDPPAGGVVGQVISMWHDDATRAVVANSLTEFVELIARKVEVGELHWDDDWGGVYEPVNPTK
jgi:cell wall assembly regulator SMI1